MSFGIGNLAVVDARREPRDEVHYRARAFGPDAQQLDFLVVNISPHGLMARCETPFEIGDRIRVVLPVAGTMIAEVRWTLKGRIGCQFEAMIDLATYYDLLSVLVRAR